MVMIRLNKRDVMNILSWASIGKSSRNDVGIPFEEDEIITLNKFRKAVGLKSMEEVFGQNLLRKDVGEKRESNIINFGKDFHPEFDGWIAEEEKGVWISFLISKERKKGNFSKFIDELKAKYEWVKIPTPSNDMVAICIQKGFVYKEEWFGEPCNETGEVLLWKKQKSD